MSKPALKAVPAEAEKPIDEQTIEEIIGRPAEQKATRTIPFFPIETVTAPKPNSVLTRLKELVKK